MTLPIEVLRQDLEEAVRLAHNEGDSSVKVALPTGDDLLELIRDREAGLLLTVEELTRIDREANALQAAGHRYGTFEIADVRTLVAEVRSLRGWWSTS